MTKVNTAIKNMKLPGDIEDKIRDYIITSYNSQHSQQQLNAFMALLSPNIKIEVIKYEFEHIIENIPIFRGITDAVTDLLELKTFKPDEYVMK